MGDVQKLRDADDDEARKEAARRARAAFLGKVSGAKLRAEQLPRDLTRVLPFAVANQMMVEVLTGAVPIRSAGEAAQVAKAMVEIGRLELGEGNSAEPATPEEREARAKELSMLINQIKAERDRLEGEAAGVPTPAQPQSADEAAS